MKDKRLTFFRAAFDALVESLDATVRIARWESGGEPVPEPLRQSAAQLLDRLGAANRLATGNLAGSPVVVTAMKAMAAAIVRLDTAFVAYRKQIERAPDQVADAANTLDSEIGTVKAEAESWTQ